MKNVDFTKPFKVYDDRSRGTTYNCNKILFQNDEVVLAYSKRYHTDYPKEHGIILIDKMNCNVMNENIYSYYAENY